MRFAAPAFVVLLASMGCKGSGSAAGDGTADVFAPQPKPTSSTPANEAIPAASVQALVNREHLPPYTGPTGSLEGTVTIKGDPAPRSKNRNFSKCPAAEWVYGKLFREGPARPDGARPVADVLMAVTGYSGGYLPEQKPARLVTIENCAMSSRVIDVTIGQRIDVKNLMSDKIFAPAFVQAPSVLALVAPSAGDPISLYPQAPGLLTMFDRFGAGSDYLSAEVYILVQPLHAVTDIAGHYRIDGVPVGDVKVNGLLGVVQSQANKPAHVRANVVETVDLELTYTTPVHVEAPRGDAARPVPLN